EHDIAMIIRGLLEDRLANPQNDLATELTQGRVDGEPPDMDKLVSIGSLAFIAGQDPTAGNLAYAMLHLATHREDRQRIVAQPEIVPLALEELTRLYNAGGPVGRIAAHDQ